MNSKKSKIYIIDTSVILSGKPIDIKDGKMITTQSVSNELKPGGKDYKIFQYLLEKGLNIMLPSDDSIKKVKKISIKTGDYSRLSKTDIEVLALALDNKKNEVIILTDDYSIQNVADDLKIKYISLLQKGIKKKFIWISRCTGCGKKFKDDINICPICGSATNKIVTKSKEINN